MLRNKPRLPYCGLTVILSNPSRHDTSTLLGGTGGVMFNNQCLRPAFNSMQVDVRLCDETEPLLPNTKCILLCGERAMHQHLFETKNQSLGEMRGSPFVQQGIVYIPTYLPQDAYDHFTDLERGNPLAGNHESGDDDDEDEDDATSKRHGRTSRRNYFFWLRADTRKAIQVIKNGGKIPTSEWPAPTYHIYPSSQVVCDVLDSANGGFLWFDMETDYEDCNMQCFSFSVDGHNIYAVPCLDYNYKPAYTNLHKILRSFVLAIARNCIVAHNGASFDFFVLGYKYNIPVGSCYDTMLAMHRCFPDIEKSLGHCTSYWTWERFHKDEDSSGYMNREQMTDRLRYCAKDVRTMFLVHKGIERYSKTIPGLEHSIATVMSGIRPYLITSLQGIRYDEAKRKSISDENDALMMQYMRCCRLLIGDEGFAQVQQAVKGGKGKAFPGSNTQCCEYFHNMLGYPIIQRSPKTGKPSLGKKHMFTLALKHENPVISFVMAYREVAKSFGTLQFIPWKDNNNKVIPLVGGYDTQKVRALNFIPPQV